MNLSKFAVITAGLCAIVIASLAAQPSPHPARAPRAPHAAHKDACGDIPIAYDARTFRAFTQASSNLDSPNFSAFKSEAFDEFEHAFSHGVPQRELAARLAIYGYDYIGSYRGFILFYRRPEGWWQTSSIPLLTAPNGEVLPPVSLPYDINPEWPAPGLLVTQSPFIGAVVLPQQIIALPCRA